MRNLSDQEKTEYIFPNNVAGIIFGAMPLCKHDCLVVTLRKASNVWRVYTQNVRDSWKEQVKQLNAVPVSGLLSSCP